MSPIGSGERLTGTGMLSAWRTRLWEVKELMGTKTGVDAHRKGNGNCGRMGRVEKRQPLCELRELMENSTHFSIPASPAQLQKVGVFLPSPHSQLVSVTGAGCRWAGVTARQTTVHTDTEPQMLPARYKCLG